MIFLTMAVGAAVLMTEPRVASAMEAGETRYSGRVSSVEPEEHSRSTAAVAAQKLLVLRELDSRSYQCRRVCSAAVMADECFPVWYAFDAADRAWLLRVL